MWLQQPNLHRGYFVGGRQGQTVGIFLELLRWKCYNTLTEDARRFFDGRNE
jgi:hypothetical protein